MKKLFYNINSFFNRKLELNENLIGQLKNEKLNILDIGASGSYHVNKFNIFFSKYPNVSTIIKFDEINRIEQSVSDKVYDDYLWSENTSMNFYTTYNKVSSSFYKPNQKNLQDFVNFTDHVVIDEQKKKLKKLDDIEFDFNFDFIKIDAEGSEFEILKGAEKSIKKNLGFEIEQQFIERFENSPSYQIISEHIDKLGYEVFLMNTESWKKKNSYTNINTNLKLVWADFLYFLKYENFKNLVLEHKNREIIIIKQIILFLMYNLHNEAKSLIDKLLKDDLISINFYDDLKKFLLLNLESNTKIILNSFLQLLFSILILFIGIFISRYRANSLNYFNKCFRNFFHLISKLTRFKGEKNSVTHDLNF